MSFPDIGLMPWLWSTAETTNSWVRGVRPNHRVLNMLEQRLGRTFIPARAFVMDLVHFISQICGQLGLRMEPEIPEAPNYGNYLREQACPCLARIFAGLFKTRRIMRLGGSLKSCFSEYLSCGLLKSLQIVCDPTLTGLLRALVRGPNIPLLCDTFACGMHRMVRVLPVGWYLAANASTFASLDPRNPGDYSLSRTHIWNGCAPKRSRRRALVSCSVCLNIEPLSDHPIFQDKPKPPIVLPVKRLDFVIRKRENHRTGPKSCQVWPMQHRFHQSSCIFGGSNKVLLSGVGTEGDFESLPQGTEERSKGL